MVVRQLLAATAAVMLLNAGLAGADEVRYVQDGGNLYQETRRVVQRPVVETRIEETTRTVYREELTTETRDTLRTSWIPVTEYQCESYVAHRWNPLAKPYVAYRMVPRTCWQQQSEVVKVPVTCRRLVPQTETVRRPVTTCRMVAEETVSRVAVRSPAPLAASIPPPPATPAHYQEIGGLARLDKDPPRHGMATAWRPSETVR